MGGMKDLLGDEPFERFSRRGARLTDPDTSREAAARPRSADRAMVLAILAGHPDGLTDFELAEIAGRQQTSVGKRRGELRDLGLVEATEQRRPSPSGSSAIVWRITAQGATKVRRGNVIT